MTHNVIGMFGGRPIMILFIVLLIPANAATTDKNMIYSVITYVNLIDIVQETPHTNYGVRVQVEFWNENESIDLTPDALGIEEGTCLVKISINATSDLDFEDNCVLMSNSATMFSNGSMFQGGILASRPYSVYYGVKPGIDVDYTDSRAQPFPDGQITFRLDISEPKVLGIMGDFYNANLTTVDANHTVVLDIIPVDYGNVTHTINNYFHVRVTMVDPAYIFLLPYTGSLFNFEYNAEILNAGQKYQEVFSNDCTIMLIGSISLSGSRHDRIQPPYCRDKQTTYIYHAGRTALNGTFRVFFDGVIIDSLPDGQIFVQLSADLPIQNNYGASIISEANEISYHYAEIPDFLGEQASSTFTGQSKKRISSSTEFSTPAVSTLQLLLSFIMIVLVRKTRVPTKS